MPGLKLNHVRKRGRMQKLTGLYKFKIWPIFYLCGYNCVILDSDISRFSRNVLPFQGPKAAHLFKDLSEVKDHMCGMQHNLLKNKQTYIDGLVQDCSIFSVLGIQILQSGVKPSTYQNTF